MKLSVIVPTCDRPQLLRRGLEALALQTIAPGEFEVLVVDDGTAGEVEALIQSFAAGLQIRGLTNPQQGLAAARNLGAREAVGELLVFKDDDIVPCADFLATHLAAHEDGGRVVALGSLPHPADLPLTPFLYYLERVRHYDLFLRYGSAESIPFPPVNGNSSIRRVHFEASGGYDTRFSEYGGEDTELGYRLLRRGFRFLYVPNARGDHYLDKDFDTYCREMYSSGKMIRVLVEKHPEALAQGNLDIALGSAHPLPLQKQAKRAVFLSLCRAPWFVSGMERILGAAEHPRWRHSAYPLYLLVSHFHYARGMISEDRHLSHGSR